jgi:citronellol/citronellal dehydrogenase
VTAFRPVLADGALAGQRIWVTGAGTGIGRATALRLAQLGAQVGGCGRHAESLQATADLVAAAGGRFVWQVCDVRDPVQAVAALDAFASQGGLNGLVNNAGGQFHTRAEDISPRGFAAVVDLNLNAAFNLMRAAWHWMARGVAADADEGPVDAAPADAATDAARAAASPQGGSIVNISISPVERGALGVAHSVAARSGVAGLTRSLALEWGGQGVRVNCLAPGAVTTEAFVAKYPQAAAEALGATTPLGRNASPAEVAELTAFLLSPAGALITGQVLRIDAGMFLGAPLDLRPAPGGAAARRASPVAVTPADSAPTPEAA